MSPAVTVRFSEAVVGVGTGSFVLRQGSTVVPATVTYTSATATAVLRPLRPLAPMTTFSVALSSSIRDTSGNATRLDDLVLQDGLVGDLQPHAHADLCGRDIHGISLQLHGSRDSPARP